MKSTKKIAAFFLAAGMLFSSLPTYAFEKPENATESLQNGYSSTSDAYAIYPIPQNVSYTGGSFTLGTNVSVVKEEGIDAYTDNFLTEILTDYGRTKTTASATDSKSQILLGIQGSGGVADAYASANLTLSDADLFTKTDSYLLSAKDGTILILGQDTDAVYHGLATLQMMFSSFNGSTFLNAQIEDYAVMKMRGFIEGFYGGWNYEGRKSLMRFARDVKMNTYIYASKTDRYHTTLWDAKYPDDEIEKIRELVQTGDETKVKYCWSVHAANFFSSLPSTGSADYETKFNENFDKLTAKFQQLYDVGVRKFAILNDDFGSGSHSEVVRMLNKLDDEFLVPNGCENLTYCMKGYNKAWSGSGDELRAMNDLNESIDLFWTGDDVNSPITQETVTYVKEKSGHEAVFWLNYPVNEHGKSGIYLGSITHYARDGVTGLAGAVSNPCLYTEANKPGLFQLACLFWNNNNYLAQADKIWEDSFKYLQPEVYEAYLTIARNVSNCPNSSRIPAGFPESEYLKDAIDTVEAKIKKGQSILTDENARKLKNEFENILRSIDVFRENCANPTLAAELDPWLSSLRDIATAGSAALDAIFYMEQKDADGAWGALAIAGQAMGTQNTYPSKADDPSLPVALSGSKRLVPFINKLISAAKNQLIPFLNPTSTEFTPSFYAVLSESERGDSGESAKIFDKDESTCALFNQDQKNGDYYGVDLGRVLPVCNIEILQGSNDTDVDYFHNAVLEYSADGETYQILRSYDEDQTPQHILEENLDLSARFIRLRLTKTGTATKASYWTHIREIFVNKKTQEEDDFGLYASEGITGAVSLDGLTYTISPTDGGSISLPAGGYIGAKLKELSGLKNVSYHADPATGLVLQYSLNGIVWNDMPASCDGTAARYVRLYNSAETSINFTLSDFTVSVYGNSIQPSVNSYSAELSSLKEGFWDNLFDGDESTYIWTNTAQKNGQYITIDFGSEVPVYDLSVVQGTANPPVFYNANFYLSTDNSNWGEPIIQIAENSDTTIESFLSEDKNFYRIGRNDLNGTRARFLKMEVTKDSGRFLWISEVLINQTIATSDHAVGKIFTDTLTGNLDKIIDGDISSAYISEEPSDGTAYIQYPLTENNRLTSITFLQSASAITNATVKAEVYDGAKITEETLGTLKNGSSTFYFKGDKDILSLTVTWPKDTVPALYEIIPVTGESMYEITFKGDGAPKDILYRPAGRVIDLPEPVSSKPGYTFEGWNDGAKTYAAGEKYPTQAENVTFFAVWKNNSNNENKNENNTPPGVITKTVKENVTYEKGNGAYTVTDISKATVTYSAGKKKEKKIRIPETIVLDDGKTYKVTAVSSSSFKNNKTVTEITVSKNIESIGSSAFAGCTKLRKVTLSGTKLKKIGSKAFYNCKSLKNIVIKSKSLAKVEKNAFKGIHKNAQIKVPASRLKKYKKLLSKKGQKKSVKITK